jgi:hypothetical protein
MRRDANRTFDVFVLNSVVGMPALDEPDHFDADRARPTLSIVTQRRPTDRGSEFIDVDLGAQGRQNGFVYVPQSSRLLPIEYKQGSL